MSKIDNEAFAWVVRKHTHGLDDAKTGEFNAWLAADIRHVGAFARAMAIYNAIHLATSESAIPSTGAAANSANADYFGPDRRDTSSAAFSARRRQLLLGGLAAGLALTAGKFGYGFLHAGTVLTTAKGEFRRVPLQDKSIANINSGTQIEVAFTQEQRKINLRKGEAWFEVAKDKSKPFIVEAGNAFVRAVGTAFSVRRLATGSEVLVTEGTVEVWTGDGRGQRRLVTAGEHAFLAQDARAVSVTRQPDEISRKLAWREGKLVLTRQTLGEAVADFNRYSPKMIVIVDPSLQDKRLIGQYQLDAPELFAKDVSMILDVPVLITAEKILIGSEDKSSQRNI
jgi:transmembrane sensor